jgi:hypothetical protein
MRTRLLRLAALLSVLSGPACSTELASDGSEAKSWDGSSASQSATEQQGGPHSLALGANPGQQQPPPPSPPPLPPPPPLPKRCDSRTYFNLSNGDNCCLQPIDAGRQQQCLDCMSKADPPIFTEYNPFTGTCQEYGLVTQQPIGCNATWVAGLGWVWVC